MAHTPEPIEFLKKHVYIENNYIEPTDYRYVIKAMVEYADAKLGAKPEQEAIGDIEKFVEENFKGLSDFIDDEDILLWYKSLIVSAIKDYRYEPEQEAKIEQQGEWQLCPKCNGQGLVSKPPYIAGDIDHWTSSQVSFQCDVCNGAKVLVKPVIEQQGNIKPK